MDTKTNEFLRRLPETLRGDLETVPVPLRNLLVGSLQGTIETALLSVLTFGGPVPLRELIEGLRHCWDGAPVQIVTRAMFDLGWATLQLRGQPDAPDVVVTLAGLSDPGALSFALTPEGEAEALKVAGQRFGGLSEPEPCESCGCSHRFPTDPEFAKPFRAAIAVVHQRVEAN